MLSRACLVVLFASQMLAVGPPPTLYGPQSALLAGPEIPVAYQDGEAGKYLLMKFSSPGAAGVRLRFVDFHLPSEARLYVYGLDSVGEAVSLDGPYSASGPSESGEFWSAAVAGEQVVVELQTDGEIPGDLPFEVAEVEGLDEEALAAFLKPSEAAAAREGAELRYSLFRGRALAHEVKDGLAIFEGDILLGRADELDPANPGKNPSHLRESVGITGSRYRWPGGIVPYEIDPVMPNTTRIASAVDHWNQKLAGVIRLVPRTSETNYVRYTWSSDSSMCASYVGMIGIGAQPIYLGNSCSTGNVIHETGHTVGLWHEQSREDRDTYVQIFWDNIQPSAIYNFRQNISDGDDLGTYDYGSIMHYGAYSFSANGKPTIQTIPAGISIGQRSSLSAGDMAGVRQMYSVAAPAPIPTVKFTVAASPSTAAVTVDGVLFSGTRTFNWTPGSSHTVSAVGSTGSGLKYVFSRWSDGGAATHSILAPSAPATYVAYFVRQYQVTATASPINGGGVLLSPSAADGFYAEKSVVKLTALPSAAYCFAGWNGLASGVPSTVQIGINKSYNLAALFVPGAVSVSPAEISVAAASKSGSLSVTASSGCQWSAFSNVSWIRIGSKRLTNGSSGVVTYLIYANTGPERIGTMTIEGRTVTVRQAAAK